MVQQDSDGHHGRRSRGNRRVQHHHVVVTDVSRQTQVVQLYTAAGGCHSQAAVTHRWLSLTGGCHSQTQVVQLYTVAGGCHSQAAVTHRRLPLTGGCHSQTQVVQLYTAANSCHSQVAVTHRHRLSLTDAGSAAVHSGRRLSLTGGCHSQAAVTHRRLSLTGTGCHSQTQVVQLYTAADSCHSQAAVTHRWLSLTGTGCHSPLARRCPGLSGSGSFPVGCPCRSRTEPAPSSRPPAGCSPRTAATNVRCKINSNDSVQTMQNDDCHLIYFFMKWLHKVLKKTKTEMRYVNKIIHKNGYQRRIQMVRGFTSCVI